MKGMAWFREIPLTPKIEAGRSKMTQPLKAAFWIHRYFVHVAGYDAG